MIQSIAKLAAGGVLAMGAAVMAADETPKAADPRVVSGVGQFTVDLYKALAAKPGNVFCSPLNVATAVSMTAAGAKGETADQIARTLHLERLGDAAHDGLGNLLAEVKGAIRPAANADVEKSPGLWSANAGWFDESTEILPEFIARLERSYHAAPHRVDFAHSADAARETINRWVADQTRDRIRDLLKPDNVRPGTTFVLTSAIYFKGFWTFPFDAKATTDDQFRTDGGLVPIKLMNQTASRLPYFENDALKAVTLPYKDGSLVMVVVLPRKEDGLADVEASLNASDLQAWSTNMRPTRVKLSLPKFQSTAEFDLKNTLSSLGMPDAFDPAKADFSGITGKRDTAIAAVVHKAFIEVEEKGTEAAAATAVVGVRSSAMLPQKDVIFRADHPFLYLIRDTQSGAILFMGRLSRP
ncbi:serpin family protein [Paludisphaera rhizosphaerae]|uniref:serpin family protein n=1 Tax=Paludisphaera rhizosphaerae TaxID=2711216 RepID=UPI0013EAE0DE|nr:serpin family protein [Paludisphaera rhizosphaerae]